MVNALRKWLISIFWKTAEASNSQFAAGLSKKIYIVTENDVIGCFQSASNRVNATGTTANFSVREYFFLDYLGKCCS